MGWEGDIWPEGAGAAWEAASGQRGEACIIDNRAEGYRTSAKDTEEEGAGYSLISLEMAERNFDLKILAAAAAAEGEVASAREAELDELMEAQLLEGARGEGMDDEEQPELEIWDISA